MQNLHYVIGPINSRTKIYTGIGPKVVQSVLTAAFLFAFKDVLYAQTVLLRRKMALRALTATK